MFLTYVEVAFANIVREWPDVASVITRFQVDDVVCFRIGIGRRSRCGNRDSGKHSRSKSEDGVKMHVEGFW